MSNTKYAVIDRPGYFGGNKARIYSTHETLTAARRAMGSGYIDEHGVRRNPLCIVEVDSATRRGDIRWGDMYPTVIA